MKKKDHKLVIQSKSQIIPLINGEGMSVKAVADALGLTEMTLWRWIKELRAEGHIINTLPKGKHKRMPL